ncbi:DUF2059 domain-containing protein [Meridianimarinicoccus sp. MJW13]|uniref:DUF2059 domain-containing protein n=1 Tax=Meridianimarinicoccus sp. MJW13 TaxID=2720031 RepID=UPI00186684BF|nr:DUF2059 domain-containing protein [Fluviibacterium sp. MJW13]
MRILIPLAFVLFPLSVAAQPARLSDQVLDALELEALLVVLQDEAVESGADLAVDLSGEEDLDGWRRTLADLNAPDKVAPRMRDAFADALDDEMAESALAFFTTSPGQDLVQLELSARQALRDPDIETAILSRFETEAASGAGRVDAIEAFIEANDLIDLNVLGALNANAAFLLGMRDGDPEGYGGNAGDEDILQQVWVQEPEIRQSTTDWVHAFLWLAYQPVSDADFDTYLTFTESQAGQALNVALFKAFDALFVSTSYETGMALSLFLSSQDI